MLKHRIERRLARLAQRLRSGKLDDPGRSQDGELPASRLVDRDPPSDWNYMRGRTWSQKWLVSVSLGPWREARALEVMDRVLDHLGRRRLSSLRRSGRLPFPRLTGDWQWQ